MEVGRTSNGSWPNVEQTSDGSWTEVERKSDRRRMQVGQTSDEQSSATTAAMASGGAALQLLATQRCDEAGRAL